MTYDSPCAAAPHHHFATVARSIDAVMAFELAVRPFMAIKHGDLLSAYYRRRGAELMGESLEADFAVPVRGAKVRSRDTQKNAANSTRILLDSCSRVILVAHAVDMRRAQGEFALARVDVIATPICITTAWSVDRPLDLLSNANALCSSCRAAYEITAVLANWLGLLGRGRMPMASRGALHFP